METVSPGVQRRVAVLDLLERALPQVSLGFVWVDLWLVGASRATAWSNDSSGRVASIAGVGRVMAGVGRLASAVEGFASAPPQVASARLTSQ